MLLPLFYRSTDTERAWSIPRAGAYGAALGALAALFKMFGPLRTQSFAQHPAGSAVELAAAALGFALLCIAAAALRNLAVRHFAER